MTNKLLHSHISIWCFEICSRLNLVLHDSFAWETWRMSGMGNPGVVFNYKGKGKVTRVLKWAPHHEGVLRKWRYCSKHSLTLALDESEWWASRPGRFKPRETAPDTHWIGSWGDPRTGLDAVVKIIASPCRDSIPDHPVRSSALYYWAIPAPCI
jgi:hypothetical protein